MSSTAKTDPELLAAARRDPHAFKEFYDRYALMIGFWLRIRTGSDDLAAELTAETFAQAWLSVRRFKGSEDDSGAPWLFGIARNVLGTYLRKRMVETAGRLKLGMPVGQVDDEFEQVEERLTAEAVAPAVRDAFAMLPVEQREALELRTIGQLPYADVADRLGCSENAARLRVSRALGALRESLRGDEA